MFFQEPVEKGVLHVLDRDNFPVFPDENPYTAGENRIRRANPFRRKRYISEKLLLYRPVSGIPGRDGFDRRTEVHVILKDGKAVRHVARPGIYRDVDPLATMLGAGTEGETVLEGIKRHNIDPEQVNRIVVKVTADRWNPQVVFRYTYRIDTYILPPDRDFREIMFSAEEKQARLERFRREEIELTGGNKTVLVPVQPARGDWMGVTYAPLYFRRGVVPVQDGTMDWHNYEIIMEYREISNYPGGFWTAKLTWEMEIIGSGRQEHSRYFMGDTAQDVLWRAIDTAEKLDTTDRLATGTRVTRRLWFNL